MLGAIPDASFALSFGCLNQALSDVSLLFSPTVCYEDPSSPFRITATLGQWQITERRSGRPARVNITISSGTLLDADKGEFPLAGVVLTMRVAGRLAPVAVVNSGPLSPLQRVGLLDAVTTYLNHPTIHYAIATIDLASCKPTTLTGFLAVVKKGPTSRAAFFLSGERFLEEAVMPGLSASFGLADGTPAFCFDASSHRIVATGPITLRASQGDVPILTSYSLTIAGDRLVTTGRFAWSAVGVESAFTVRCSHSARFEADTDTLLFEADPNPSITPHEIPDGMQLLFSNLAGNAAELLATSTATASTQRIKRLMAFKVYTGGLNDASVYLQSDWRVPQEPGALLTETRA